MISGAVFQDLVLQEHVEEVLCCDGVWHPPRDLYVQVLLGCPLREELLEFVYQSLVLCLQLVYQLVLVLDVPLQLTD